MLCSKIKVNTKKKPKLDRNFSLTHLYILHIDDPSSRPNTHPYARTLPLQLSICVIAIIHRPVAPVAAKAVRTIDERLLLAGHYLNTGRGFGAISICGGGNCRGTWLLVFDGFEGDGARDYVCYELEVVKPGDGAC